MTSSFVDHLPYATVLKSGPLSVPWLRRALIVLSGVPQGSVLGPVLFLIFINDLPDSIRSSVCLVADDCVLYRNIHSLQDCLTLQEDLTSLGQRESDWQMKFNVAKCHSMRMTRHQHHKQILFDYSLHNQTLKNIQSAKYLGITFTDNMDWGQHVSEISSEATKTLGLDVIKLEYSLKLKIKCNDWLLVDTCPQAANHGALF